MYGVPVPISSSAPVHKKRDASGKQLHAVVVAYQDASTADWIELDTTSHLPQVFTLLAVHAYGEGGDQASRQPELVVHTADEDTSIPASAKRIYKADSTAVADQIADSLGAGVPVYIPDGYSLYVIPAPNTGSNNSGKLEVVVSPNVGPA